MRCVQCGFDTLAGMKFCGQCGTKLAAVCEACGFVNPDGFAFCGRCGGSLNAGRRASSPGPQQRFASPDSYTPTRLAEKILTSKAALEGERKQVTVLFADLTSSMELLVDRDPEDARKLLDPVLELMIEAVHHYEGTVNQVMGDGIMALFGAPLAHEDHAVRACYAALRMQESMKGYAEEPRRTHGVYAQIRVGLNSGEVVVRAIGNDLHMDYSAIGQTTHLAARMEQLADPGAILLITRHAGVWPRATLQVKSLGPVPVKGLAEPVEVYEHARSRRRRVRVCRPPRCRGLTRLCRPRSPRSTQLADSTSSSWLKLGAARSAAIVGEAGVGKSRLVYEFTHSHRVAGLAGARERRRCLTARRRATCR